MCKGSGEAFLRRYLTYIWRPPFNPLVTGEASAARRYVPGEFGLTSAMRRGATRRVTFATARPLYVPGGRGNI